MWTKLKCWWSGHQWVALSAEEIHENAKRASRDLDYKALSLARCVRCGEKA